MFNPSIGNFDVTNIADGLAKFLVGRVKQELSTSFFEKFKENLDSNEQIQILFPVSYNALKAIDKESITTPHIWIYFGILSKRSDTLTSSY